MAVILNPQNSGSDQIESYRTTIYSIQKAVHTPVAFLSFWFSMGHQMVSAKCEEDKNFPRLSDIQAMRLHHPQARSAQKLSTAMHTLFVDCMVFRCSLLPMELRSVFIAQMESQWTEEGQAGLFERIRRRLVRLSPEPCTEAQAQASVDTLIKKIRRIDGRLLRDWVR